MKLICYLTVLKFLMCLSAYGAEKNLLQDGFAAVAVSTDSIEAIYLQALEKNHGLYVELGVNDPVRDIDFQLAGVQIVREPQILFISDHAIESVAEIAFENVKLSQADVDEINDTLIFSQIKARSVDPKAFDVNLD